MFGSITGGDLLVQVMVDHGIRHVFSIIGGQMATTYDAIRLRNDIHAVGVRRETSAPLMACGYAAATGASPVSMTTVGAGVVYEVAGLINAWYSYLPVISIAPQVQSWKMKPHQENLQGCNQDEIFAPITKWNAIIYNWKRIPQLVNRAVREAVANVPGPVHLDIPVDILFALGRISSRERNAWMPPAVRTKYQGFLPGSAEEVDRAIALIRTAKRPLALFGQGMGRRGRFPGFQKSLDALGIPTLLTRYSSGVMNGSDSALAGYVSAFLENEERSHVLEQADLVLVIGIDSELIDPIRSGRLAGKTIVQVEVDPGALDVSTRGLVGANADPLSFLKTAELAIVGEAGGQQKESWESWLSHVKSEAAALADSARNETPGLARLLEALAARMTAQDIVVVDGHEPVRAARHFFGKSLCRECFLMDVENVAGAGLPFALGAKVGLPDTPVTLICDQDSLFRHMMELQTAADLGMTLRIICVDSPASSPIKTASVLEGLGVDISDTGAGETFGAERPNKRLAWVHAAGLV